MYFALINNCYVFEDYTLHHEVKDILLKDFESKYKEVESILQPIITKAYQANMPEGAGQGMPGGMSGMPGGMSGMPGGMPDMSEMMKNMKPEDLQEMMKNMKMPSGDNTDNNDDVTESADID